MKIRMFGEVGMVGLRGVWLLFLGCVWGGGRNVDRIGNGNWVEKGISLL